MPYRAVTPMDSFPEALHRGSGMLAAAALAALALVAGSAQAGPMQCTTTLEAPVLGVQGRSGGVLAPAAPVEITRCTPVETIPELVERRAYTWTTPYARGVSLAHQITDILGIAVAGDSGTRVMGLGFADQTLVWDGSAIQNTYEAQLRLMSKPTPWRSADLRSEFPASIGSASTAQATASVSAPAVSWNSSVRGLW